MKSNVCYKSNPCSPQPSVVVTQTVDGIKGLSNAFVYVISNNTTYFVSSCKEITVIFSGPVYVDDYAFATNPLDLRNQTVYDFKNNVAATYNAQGEYRTFKLNGGN